MVTMRVLVVDDDTGFRAILRAILHQQPCLRLCEAAGGPQAWDLLQQGFLPDLCLLDVLMPEVSGMDLLERMRSHPFLRDIKVILCTAVHDRENIVKAANLGVHYYFLKPFSPSLVLAEVRKLRDALESAPPVLEPEQIRQRLGLNPYQFAERLHSLTRITDQGLVTLKSALDRRDLEGASWCLDALLQASVEVNAQALRRALYRLGSVFRIKNFAGLTEETECVKAECRRLRYYSARITESNYVVHPNDRKAIVAATEQT
jgi:two-component system, chemotaxis family, chemotaxis protein CheY